ncbi:putative 20S cyclosome subunit [Annulohypoxylon maeteangense]|uniref:putative 20S cyclosome subunit n=1 Tax=Annulohypoxylon maeteangense TaxID=1927788 RepID=UPI002007E5D3|nr:putative 20S cyclosome subunit [Annulohypoxylon maeteangense]KAI0887461.1 putative 20S cyclosome subunit [Annulohypoxylon maeteangense]
MAPTGSAITGQLRQLVYYHLDNISYDNALFFAERLSSHDHRSSEPQYLLALCYFRLGDFHTAYDVSKPVGTRGTNVSCSYIFAQCCLELGQYKDGIVALEKSRGLWSRKSSLGKHGATSRALHPDSASTACLLGKLYKAYDDKTKASLNFEEALKINPFMWDAFTALCDMGVPVRSPNVFRLNETLVESLSMDPMNGISSEQKDSSVAMPAEPQPKKASFRSTIFDSTGDPFDSQRSTAGNEMALGSNFLASENDFMSKINAARSRVMTTTADSGLDHMETPISNHHDSNIPRINHQPEPPQAPTRRTKNAQPLDSNLADMPPKMGFRAGTKRVQKLQDKAQEDIITESNPTLRATGTGVSGIERKRTVSGHLVQPRQQHSEEPGAPQRRSARLNLFRGGNSKVNSGAPTAGASRELKKARPPGSRIIRPNSSGSNVGRAVSGNRKPLEENTMDVDHAEAPRIKEVHPQPAIIKSAEPESVKVEETLKYLLELLKKFGSGYLALSQYRCAEALASYNLLPRAHRESPWVLSQMGRAYYEQAEYGEAEKYFRMLRVRCPTRLEDMEVYSTILWFLKRETDLSFLAHDLVDLSWHSPQAWCALGNAWSLARDHEQALRCFKRATQLNPKFAYAFTLQGHEHVSNEEYEKALTAYRQAISADRRHYNAYYGIGRVYEKLGNYDKAYVHFHSASVINPTNAVLICCIGNVLEKQRQIVKALQFFTKATELAPHAAQTRYKKARALLALNQLDEAQKELEILKTMAPDEATVHFLLGKLYKSLNDKGSAVRHFTIALNLDPKASHQIKEAIESLEDDDSFDDSMMA